MALFIWLGVLVVGISLYLFSKTQTYIDFIKRSSNDIDSVIVKSGKLQAIILITIALLSIIKLIL